MQKVLMQSKNAVDITSKGFLYEFKLDFDPIKICTISFFLQTTMIIKSVFPIMCILLASSIKATQSAVTNCTSAPCDIKTCSNTSTACQQICSATPCKTECSSPGGCHAKCPIGGCSKMSCNIKERSPAVRVSTAIHFVYALFLD